MPDGWQRVSSLGVQLGVPGSWAVGNDAHVIGCRGTGAVLVRGGGTAPAVGCAPGPGDGRTIVEIQGSSGGHRPQPGQRRLPDGKTERVWLSRDGSTVVRGTSPSADLLERVFGTLQEVRVDWAGCPSRFAAPGWDAAREAPAARVADADSVVVCLYQAGEAPRDTPLAASTVLRGAAARAVTDALRRAPAGPNPDQPESVCLRGQPEDFVARLQFAGPGGGSPAVVHFAGCTGRYVATPGGESQVTERLLTAALGTLGVGYSWGSTGVQAG